MTFGCYAYFHAPIWEFLKAPNSRALVIRAPITMTSISGNSHLGHMKTSQGLKLELQQGLGRQELLCQVPGLWQLR